MDAILLLVEDNPNDLDLTLHALKKFQLGDQLIVARDGVEALDYVLCRGKYSKRRLEDRPRLILTDIRLPRISGLDLVQQIKTNRATHSIPIVVLSVSDEENDIAQSYACGANGYVVKPLKIEDFIETIRVIGLYWLGVNRISSGVI